MLFNRNCRCGEKIIQHVHDAQGYTNLAGQRGCCHKHCFNAATGLAIPCGNSHVHEVYFVTDIIECHCHKICGKTGPAIQTGCGNHIHLIEGCTTTNDCHRHGVNVATGIEEYIEC